MVSHGTGHKISAYVTAQIREWGHPPWLHIPMTFVAYVAVGFALSHDLCCRGCFGLASKMPVHSLWWKELRHMSRRFEVFGYRRHPEVAPGDDLTELISAAAQDSGVGIRPGDVVVVAQKVVSKSEGAIRRLSQTTATPRSD